MDKNTAYIWLGGDQWHENFYGKLKNVRLYYDTVLTDKESKCLLDEFCTDCSPKGVCLKC